MINLNKKPFANLKKLEECKYCKGEGEYLDSFDDMWGNNTQFWATCEFCEGEGKVKEGENPSWL
jgi:DnaJ-class molecular chaperone